MRVMNQNFDFMLIRLNEITNRLCGVNNLINKLNGIYLISD